MLVSKRKYKLLEEQARDYARIINSQRVEISDLYNTIADLDGIIENLEKKQVKKPAKKVAKKVAKKTTTKKGK